MIKDTYPILNKKYYLIQKLGEGATSCVFLGTPIGKEDIQVAIKIITHPKLKADAYDQEIKILSNIHDNNIIGLLDYGVGYIEKNQQISEDKRYLVLEYASKGVLFNFIRDTGKPFGEDYGRYLFYELLKGVEAIHSSGFAHRDLKIENIMIDNNYNVKIGDFGFASRLEGKNGTGKLSSQVGTLKYCAPEILRKRPYVGTRVDIFSIGICLFVIVFGKYPFGSATKYDPGYKLIMNQQFQLYWNNFQKPNQFNVSEEFKDLFNQMVKFEPTFRPSIANILEHPFMKKPMPTKEQFCLELQQRENIILQKQQMLIMKNLEIQPTGNGEVFKQREKEKPFTSQFIIPKVKKNYVSNRSYIIRFKGVTPYAFMNRFVTALEDYDEFEKEITFDQKKLKILIKAQGFDKEEEEENESDEDKNNENNDEEEDGEDDIKLYSRELKVIATLKEDEEAKCYLMELKKKEGDFEDYFKLYEVTKNIINSLY